MSDPQPSPSPRSGPGGRHACGIFSPIHKVHSLGPSPSITPLLQKLGYPLGPNPMSETLTLYVTSHSFTFPMWDKPQNIKNIKVYPFHEAYFDVNFSFNCKWFSTTKYSMFISTYRKIRCHLEPLKKIYGTHLFFSPKLAKNLENFWI